MAGYMDIRGDRWRGSHGHVAHKIRRPLFVVGLAVRVQRGLDEVELGMRLYLLAAITVLPDWPLSSPQWRQ